MNVKQLLFVVLAVLLSAPTILAVDIFDLIPEYKKDFGIEKLTPRERAKLSQFVLSMSSGRESSSGGSCSPNVEDACESAYSKCKRECPSSVFDWQSGNYLYSTDANSKCEDACRAGRRNCEP